MNKYERLLLFMCASMIAELIKNRAHPQALPTEPENNFAVALRAFLAEMPEREFNEFSEAVEIAKRNYS